jgi:hypothetical protein
MNPAYPRLPAISEGVPRTVIALGGCKHGREASSRLRLSPAVEFGKPRALAPYGALTTGKSLVVPSCGGRYHAPSIPIDLHWESSLVPA